MNIVTAWLSTLGGPIVFAGAWYIHQKVRLTRTACILAFVGGLMTYAAAIGTRVNEYAAKLGILLVVAVFVGICVIVADVKGKKKGADKPALIAFFLVPLFFVAFLSSLPAVGEQFGDGLEKAGDNVQQQTAR